MSLDYPKEKTVVAIDGVDYLVTQESLKALQVGEVLIPLVRLFDKKIFFITKEKLEKSEKVDQL